MSQVVLRSGEENATEAERASPRAVIKLNEDPDVEASAFGLSLKDPVRLRAAFRARAKELPLTHPPRSSPTPASTRRSAPCTATTSPALMLLRGSR